MKLSDASASVELQIVGYEGEYEPGDTPEPEAQWLVIRGAISAVGVPLRTFEDLSLDTREAQSLGTWMASVSAGEIRPAEPWEPSPALLHFTEPDLAVRVVQSDEVSVTTRWYFAHPEASADSAEDLVFHNVFAVDVTVTRTHFEEAANSWNSDGARYPDR